MYTDTGLFHQFKMKDVPLCKLKDKGIPVDNISNFDSASENILKIDAFDNLKDKILLFATGHGMIKRVAASEFETNKKTVASTKLEDGDKLVFVDELNGSNIVLVSEKKSILRFAAEDVAMYKKTSVGVRGMRLDEEDCITAVYDFDPAVKYVVKIGNKRVNLVDIKLKKRDQKPDVLK